MVKGLQKGKVKVFYINIENGKINGVSKLNNSRFWTDEYFQIEVSEDIYNAFLAEPKKYIYSNGDIVENPDYETEQIEAREKTFSEEFFNTSLGYVRRKVTMQDGSIKDFLSDILPLLQVGVPIITYNKPDFETSDTPTQNVNQIVTEDFINECKRQMLADFYGAQAI